jgi:hypothetical protein
MLGVCCFWHGAVPTGGKGSNHRFSYGPVLPKVASGTPLAGAGWVLFGVTLLAFIGLLVVGLGLTECADAAAMEHDVPPKGIDFDRDPEVRRQFMEDAP